MENNLFQQTGNIRISSHASWAMQRTHSIPTMDQRGPYRIYRHMLDSLPGRCAHIFEYHRTTLARCWQYPGGNKELWHENQNFEMRVHPKSNEVPGVHHLTKSSQDRSGQEASHLALDKLHQNIENPMFQRILQCLLMLHQRIQPNSKTPIR